MESILAALIGLIAAVALYRYLRQRNATAQQRVDFMLRQVDELVRDGLSEREALLRLLLARPGWQQLPAEFLGELVGRLGNRVAVIRIVLLSEDCGYTKDKLLDIAKSAPANGRSERVACLLAEFGYQLQSEHRFKEAEFVQRLALALAPGQTFTNLPLAATLFEMNRYGEAQPLFERGLHEIDLGTTDSTILRNESLSRCLGGGVDEARLRQSYGEMLERCVKALESSRA